MLVYSSQGGLHLDNKRTLKKNKHIFRAVVGQVWVSISQKSPAGIVQGFHGEEIDLMKATNLKIQIYRMNNKLYKKYTVFRKHTLQLQ